MKKVKSNLVKPVTKGVACQSKGKAKDKTASGRKVEEPRIITGEETVIVNSPMLKVTRTECYDRILKDCVSYSEHIIVSAADGTQTIIDNFYDKLAEIYVQDVYSGYKIHNFHIFFDSDGAVNTAESMCLICTEIDEVDDIVEYKEDGTPKLLTLKDDISVSGSVISQYYLYNDDKTIYYSSSVDSEEDRCITFAPQGYIVEDTGHKLLPETEWKSPWAIFSVSQGVPSIMEYITTLKKSRMARNYLR